MDLEGRRNRLQVRIMEPRYDDSTVDMWCSHIGDRCLLVGFLCDDEPSRKRILRAKDGLSPFYGDGTRYLIVLNPDKRNMGPLCWVPIQQLDTHGILLIRD